MLSGIRLEDGTFVAVDIETTGSRPGQNGVIEIGAVKIERGEVVDDFAELVDPGHAIPPAIAALTGITDAMVAGSPPVSDALTRFAAFADGAVLVAHNHRFDLGFLDWEAERAWNAPLQRPVLDTLALARRLHPAEDRHNLRDLAARYGVPTVPTHRAPSDARATGEIFVRMAEELRSRGLATAGEVAAFCGLDAQGELARRLVLTTDLPDAPGVYLFRDASGRVIHIGRANDIRVRVRSYFYATASPKCPPVGAEVEDIQCIPCLSDLDALLLESRLISRYRPPHNATILRGDSGVVVLHADLSVRYPALKVTSRRPRRGAVIGPFTSRAALETVVDLARTVYGVRRCTWRLDRATAAKECSYRDTGVCPSPCVDPIDPQRYRERVESALAVFDGRADEFREELLRRQEAAAEDERYEDAIRYRDGVRALDRCLSALATVRGACDKAASVIVEGGASGVALHFVRHGYLYRTLRLTRAEAAADGIRERLGNVLSLAFDPEKGACDPRAYTPRQMRDVFLIEAYRRQHAPLEIEVADRTSATVGRLVSAIKRQARIPRKSHGAS